MEERKQINKIGSAMSQGISKYMCTVHPDKCLEYFCDPCDEVICGQCMIDEHRIHGEVKYASDILDKHVQDLRNMIADVKDVMLSGESMLKSLEADSNKLDVALDNGLSGVQSYFTSIREILNDKEKEIINEMKTQAKRRRNLSHKHIDTITEALEGAGRSKRFLESVVDQETLDVSLLVEEKELRIQISARMRQVEEVILDSKATQFVFSKVTPFTPDPTLKMLCSSLQYSNEQPIESNQYVTMVPLQQEFVKPSIPRRVQKSRVHYKSEGAKRVVRAAIAPMQLRSLSISDSPLIRGSPTLTRKLSVQPPTGEILQPVCMIETKSLIGRYTAVTAYPSSVCCFNEGTLLVTDSKHHLFRVVTSTGKCLQTIGSEGNEDGLFNDPTGIALDLEGNILVVDGKVDGKVAGRLQKFSMGG